MADNLILTTIGLAKLASATPEDQLRISHIAVGNGGGAYPPLDPSMTELVEEVWRGTASEPIRDPSNPVVLIFETIIPANEGGFFIREIGLFDDEGNMIAIGQTGVVEKPYGETGSPVTMTIRVRLALANADQTSLVISDSPYMDHQATSNRDAENAHPISSITGLAVALSEKVAGDDNRLANAREWSAETVSEEEAAAGESTARRAWTAQRVRLAVSSWWESISTPFGRSLVALDEAADAREALELGAAATLDVGTGEDEIPRNSDLSAGMFGLGVGQTYQDFTTARGIDIAYTNTTGRPIFVSGVLKITAQSSGTQYWAYFNVDFETVLGVGVTRTTSDSLDLWVPFSGIVPAGSTYNLEVSGPGSYSIDLWKELV